MIYTIGGIKGGSGKTTVATNLTVWLSSQGRDVLLVDADDQETATDFTVWRSKLTDGATGYTAIQLSDSAVRTEALKLAPKYDDIVIDTGGRDTASQRAALSIANLFLLPFIPRSFDIWTLEKVTALIEEVRPINPALKILVFLNRSDPRGADNLGASELLSESGAFTFLETALGNRKAFANAAAMGMGVTEVKPRDKKAIRELDALFQRCQSAVNGTESHQ